MCENNNSDVNGIAEILELILVLQKNACCPESCLDSCDRPILGPSISSITCNTRPVMIYLCGQNSVPLAMPTVKDTTVCSEGVTNCSTVFRVERLTNNAATFRVLAPNDDETSSCAYVATDSFFSCNINCICCLRCLNDTCVECI